MATEWPRAQVDGVRNRLSQRPLHGMGCLLCGHRPEDWNQPRSCAARLVNLVTNLLPGSRFEFVRQSAWNSDQRRKLFCSALLLIQDQPQSLLGQGTESGLLASRNSLGPLEQVICNFNSCLHDMATHIYMERCPSQGETWSRLCAAIRSK